MGRKTGLSAVEADLGSNTKDYVARFNARAEHSTIPSVRETTTTTRLLTSAEILAVIVKKRAKK